MKLADCNKDRRVSLKRAKDGVYSGIFIIYSSNADSETPAFIPEIEPSGGCSVHGALCSVSIKD